MLQRSYPTVSLVRRLFVIFFSISGTDLQRDLGLYSRASSVPRPNHAAQHAPGNTPPRKLRKPGKKWSLLCVPFAVTKFIPIGLTSRGCIIAAITFAPSASQSGTAWLRRLRRAPCAAHRFVVTTLPPSPSSDSTPWSWTFWSRAKKVLKTPTKSLESSKCRAKIQVTPTNYK